MEEFGRGSKQRTRGSKSPLAVRWLGRASGVKTRHKEGAIVASSVAFTVVGEVFNRLSRMDCGFWDVATMSRRTDRTLYIFLCVYMLPLWTDTVCGRCFG